MTAAEFAERPGPTEPSRRSLEHQPGPRVVLRDPGDVVAAVAVMLGFHPGPSLVLVALHGCRPWRAGLLARVDLPPPREVRAVASGMADALLTDHPSAAMVLVVSGPPTSAGGEPTEMWCSAAVAAASGALRRAGVPVAESIRAEGTRVGDRWRCTGECGCGGLVADLRSSPIGAAAVVAGDVVHRDRAALEALVAPVAAHVLERRERLFESIVDAELAGPDPGGLLSGRGTVSVAEGTADVDAAVLETSRGTLVLDDSRVVRLARALCLPEVRDVALRRCLAPLPGAAEQLWTALVRETPQPEAAEPAALLAVSAYLRGNGALVNVALDRAERAMPGHRLTGLLRAAIDSCLPPSAIRSWLKESGS